jgi:formaldehyde-activating enzyme involved in methanogenesis
VLVVRHLQAGVVDVEGVRVLHHELAAAQDARAGTRLVAVLRLDLVDRQRQVLVRRVLALHEQREHLLVRGAEQEVVAAAVLEPEQAGAVLRPSVGGLVGLAGQQRREVDLLEARGVHLSADDALDVAVDRVAEGQPREDAGRDATNVARADQEPVARHLGVGRVLTQGAQEQRRHAEQHGDLQGPGAGRAGSARTRRISAGQAGSPTRSRRAGILPRAEAQPRTTPTTTTMLPDAMPSAGP